MNRKQRRSQRRDRAKGLVARAEDWTTRAVEAAVADGDMDRAVMTYAVGRVCSHHGADSFAIDDTDQSLTVTDAASGQPVTYTYEDWFLGCVEYFRQVGQELASGARPARV